MDRSLDLADLLRLGSRLEALPGWCGGEPGVNEVPDWQDWSQRPTTEDQARIEKHLAGRALDGVRILHVGVGNSQLAKAFAPRVAAVDGITIMAPEQALAQATGLPNYGAILANKYEPDLIERLPGGYDFIIDNNPTTFCCCRAHLAVMLHSYLRLLKPGGEILSDAVGLDWASTPNDPGWKVSVEEWFAIGAWLGLQPLRHDAHVVGLRLDAGPEAGTPAGTAAAGLARVAEAVRKARQPAG